MARACLGSPPIISSSFQHFRLSTAKFPAVNASHVSTTITTTTTMPHPHPSLEVAGGARERFLLPLMTILSKPYTPFPLVAYNRHLETIFAAFFRSIPQIRLRRECLRTADDGAVALDWVAGDDGRLPLETPVVILLPGLTGGSDDSYVRHMLVRARSKGWRVVVFNSRGCGDSPVTTPQESNACPLSGAVSLCNPFNLPIADEDFRKGFNIVYDKALANALCKIFKKHALLFEDMVGEYNIPSVANAKSVREFDEGLTRVSFGFKSVDDYYYNSSSSDSIKQVQIPLLCIQAANDPIAPSRGIPHEDIKGVLIKTRERGGDIDAELKRSQWSKFLYLRNVDSWSIRKLVDHTLSRIKSYFYVFLIQLIIGSVLISNL
ncbi:embryogenesis-associated protein EMB8 isoform X3 [Tripterygium wilfordii]|uniref:embryogenesis-associated protein EMB8 isoform X3 n=1 Tax=Tripterygium wilfordii TaxID=458696 RepID=UPI0018F8555A|nr:embryogenesis-associated protein EMB8 isoform X3 [Tripterygium wilfordii]